MIHIQWRGRLTKERRDELTLALRALPGAWGSEIEEDESSAFVTLEEGADADHVLREAMRLVESFGGREVAAHHERSMSGMDADDTGALWAMSHAESEALDFVDGEAEFLHEYSPWVDSSASG